MTHALDARRLATGFVFTFALLVALHLVTT